jgi:hypothetical protein
MRAIMVLAVLAFASPAMAGEDDIVLKEGTGRDLVEVNCGACHSLDYVEMNSPFLDQEKWAATIKKMIEKFGAPIAEGDVPGITEYLATNYGP